MCRCNGTGVIVYGPDTFTGSLSVKCMDCRESESLVGSAKLPWFYLPKVDPTPLNMDDHCRLMLHSHNTGK